MIRFPDNIAEHGGCLQVGFVDPGPTAGNSHDPERNFNLGAASIDKLVVKLFEIADRNPRFFDWLLKNRHAAPYFALYNESPLVREEESPAAD